MAEQSLVQEGAPGDKELTIFEHLSELRMRMIRASLALVVGTLISVVFAAAL